MGVHRGAACTQTGQNTQGHKRAEDLACEPHVSTHTTPETTGCKCKAATANTSVPVCVRAHMHRHRLFFNKAKRDANSLLTVGGLVEEGDRWPVTRDEG